MKHNHPPHNDWITDQQKDWASSIRELQEGAGQQAMWRGQLQEGRTVGKELLQGSRALLAHRFVPRATSL